MQQSGKLNGNEITISVRNLVEFILRSGDIKAGTGTMADPEVMQMGSRMHRKLQKSGGKNYQAEVPLSRTVDCGDYKLPRLSHPAARTKRRKMPRLSHPAARTKRRKMPRFSHPAARTKRRKTPRLSRMLPSMKSRVLSAVLKR